MIGLAEETIEATAWNLGSIERIPLGEGREYEVGGELIAVFRGRSGPLYAVQAKCPHREGALADGIIGAGQVICPMHSFKFDLRTGQPLGADCPKLKTYQVEVSEFGEILINLDAQHSRTRRRPADHADHADQKTECSEH